MRQRCPIQTPIGNFILNLIMQILNLCTNILTIRFTHILDVKCRKRLSFFSAACANESDNCHGTESILSVDVKEKGGGCLF